MSRDYYERNYYIAPTRSGQRKLDPEHNHFASREAAEIGLAYARAAGGRWVIRKFIRGKETE